MDQDDLIEKSIANGIPVLANDDNDLWGALTVAGGSENEGGVDPEYMWTNAADVTLSALTKTAVSDGTFSVDTANAMYIIEIPADTIQGSSTTAYDCIQLALDAPGATNNIYGAIYILWKGRYKSDTPIEPLTD